MAQSRNMELEDKVRQLMKKVDEQSRVIVDYNSKVSQYEQVVLGYSNKIGEFQDKVRESHMLREDNQSLSFQLETSIVRNQELITAYGQLQNNSEKNMFKN